MSVSSLEVSILELIYLKIEKSILYHEITARSSYWRSNYQTFCMMRVSISDKSTTLIADAHSHLWPCPFFKFVILSAEAYAEAHCSCYGRTLNRCFLLLFCSKFSFEWSSNKKCRERVLKCSFSVLRTFRKISIDLLVPLALKLIFIVYFTISRWSKLFYTMVIFNARIHFFDPLAQRENWKKRKCKTWFPEYKDM